MCNLKKIGGSTVCSEELCSLMAFGTKTSTTKEKLSTLHLQMIRWWFHPIVSTFLVLADLLANQCLSCVCVFVFYVFDRCQEVGSEERRREKREDKCPFLENSGSEEDILQILQYMATILGKNMK